MVMKKKRIEKIEEVDKNAFSSTDLAKLIHQSEERLALSIGKTFQDMMSEIRDLKKEVKNIDNRLVLMEHETKNSHQRIRTDILNVRDEYVSRHEFERRLNPLQEKITLHDQKITHLSKKR